MRMTDEHGDVWETEPASAKPTPKVAAAAVIGTPLAVLVAWLLTFWDIEMPAEVGAALGAVLAAAVGYMKRDTSKIEWADDGHADLNGLLTTVLIILGIAALIVFLF